MTPSSPETSAIGHQALYRRWRAQTFAQIVGQEPVVETLRNAVRMDRVAHGVLFVGPRGTGKTSLARILAKAVNCTNLQDGDPCDACPSCVAIREGRAFDLVEIDAASNRGIDAIRELRERIHYAPTDLRRKVYILDEAHQITKDAWNALLKSLEEPPDFVVFMFASTHPQEFPPAILSRLQRFDVRRLTVAEIEGKLQRILAADGREAEPAALRLIAQLAAGGMRDAESMLDQLLASGTERLDESRVRDLLGLAEAETIDRFVDALVTGDAITGIALLDGLEDRGRDARVFLDQVVDAIRAALVAALSGPATARHPIAPLAAAARRLAAIDPNRAGTGGLRLQLELALFSGTAPEPATERPAPIQQSRPASAATEATSSAPQPDKPAAPDAPVGAGTKARPPATEPPAAPEARPAAAKASPGSAPSARPAPGAVASPAETAP
ncbi:MAG TPA: DNA polymerase III subunit gamma/tau, partial [Candidatus Limnocylindrales bacterium]